MFSQWRHAVESLAQPPRSSQDASSDDAPTRPSVDAVRTSLSSSSQLAESALSSLKKSLVAQRSPSPALGQAQTAQAAPPAAEPTPTAAPKPRPGRTTLEDRLRARFAIGDASGDSTPAQSLRTSPAPVATADHPLADASNDEDIPVVRGPPNPLSPTSAPLPDSPSTSPTTAEAPFSLQAASESMSALPELSNSPPPMLEGAETESETPVIEAKDEHSHEAALEPTSPASVPVEEGAVTEREPSLVPEPESSPQLDSVASTADDEDHDQLASSAATEVPFTEAEAKPSVPDEYTSEADLAEPPQAPHTEATAVIPAPVEDNTSTGDVESDLPPVVGDAPAAAETLQAAASLPNGKAMDGVDIEALQKRLKLVEQRFTDVSTSFKRLQAEKLAADRVLRELTSVESVTEADALRDFLQNMNFKTEMAQDEIRRLNGKLTRQDERLEELRDIHRLEHKSQSELVEKLKAQVEEAEKLLKAAQGSTSQAEEESAKRKADIERLQGELDKANTNAKEEEEKRTKAIALLKTVRQKLVKAEKDRDDALKDITTMKEAEKAEREKEKGERAKLQAEIEKVNAERETAVQGLRAQFDKEVAGLKERHEKELAAMRGQFELEAITAKTTHVREIENRKARISDLEGTVRTLSKEKDELFDQLQMRQAELENSQSTLESLQGQNTELQYQLREATDRIALLQEEFSDVRREQDMKVQSPGPSTEEVTRLLASVESKSEAKLNDLRRRLAETERERDEGEAHWSKKLAERAREVESLKAIINSSQQSKLAESESAQALQDQLGSLQSEIRSYQKQIADSHSQLEKAAELEVMVKSQLAELSSRTADLQQLVEEGKGREAQLRAQNKTLREELRKVQSSVALLEKQRGPGVGYWASRNESTSEIKSPTSSISDLPRENSSRPSTPSAVRSDEEVNFEYLRNVIMQFLEHKEMRPHLIRILSTILRFTPQETRRLIAKV